MAKYLLRNISTSDINLGDLRYKIPAGKVRDLLSPTARLDPKLIEKSRTSGSIAARLGKTLIEVEKEVVISAPKREISKKAVIDFPNRKKSSITIDVAELDDKVNDMILSEDNDLVKEFDEDDMYNIGLDDVPLVTRDKEESKKDNE